MDITQKCAVIVVSHSMPNLAKISTDILLLNKGENIYLGRNISKGIEKYQDQFPDEKVRIIGAGDVIINNCSVHGRTNNTNSIKYLDDLFINLEFKLLKENALYYF